MPNIIVEEFKKLIGREITESPSAVTKWLRGKLISVEEGALEAQFIVREEMTNPLGLLHGGSIALIIDDMIGATVYTLPTETHFVSVNLNVNFLNAGRLNEVITAKAKITKKGRTFIHAECSLFNSRNSLIATSTSGLVATTIQKN
jgi:uncharacterized protein (TIGR00369 family)